MNSNNLHQKLAASFKERNKNYNTEIGNCLLACSLITAKLIFQNNLKDAIGLWLQLPSCQEPKPKFSSLLSEIENVYCPKLFSYGYNFIKNLAEIEDSELLEIIIYTNSNFANNVRDILDLAESLNGGVLSSEIDNLLKLVITDRNQLEILAYGVRTVNYISDIRFHLFCSYNLDKYRWREAFTSKILLQRQDLIFLDPPAYRNEEIGVFDYAILSANQTISIDEWQHLSNKFAYQQNIAYFTKLIEWCNQQDFAEIPDFSFLTHQIPNSDLYYSDIINCLSKTKPSGNLFLSIRSKAWQSDQLFLLRKFLVSNQLIQQAIFIKTNRLNPWILLKLTPSRNTSKNVFMVNEKFFSDQGLKYNYNEKVNSRLANIINSEKHIQKTAGFVEYQLIKSLQYNIDPNACLNFEGSRSTEIIDTNNQPLENLCTAIFRGPDLSNKELSKTDVTYGFYMIGHSAISENGFRTENLTPISEEIYKQYQKNYAVYPGDLVTLSRATTNRLVLIPETAPHCIANINIIVIRPNCNYIVPTYLYLLLTSKYGKALFSSLEKGTSLKSISIKELKQLPIKVIPITKQQEITKHYNKIKAKYLKAYEEYQNNLEECYSALHEDNLNN